MIVILAQSTVSIKVMYLINVINYFMIIIKYYIHKINYIMYNVGYSNIIIIPVDSQR